MAVSLEAYWSEGTVRGSILEPERLADLLEAEAPLALRVCAIGYFDGRPPERREQAKLAPEELLVVVAQPDELPDDLHVAWHPVILQVGPLDVRGELRTVLGFDPGRSLARPGGQFVLLREVRVSLAGASPRSSEHLFAWVNRYAVERVAADVPLVFFFPGAETMPRLP
jgi:hypothetical protein